MTAERLTVREEQAGVTRRRILDACAELALRHGGLDDPALFTYARVAELAGVSERTVYRAFPTKNDLTAAFLNEATLTQGEPIPTDAAELGSFLRRICRAWDEQFPVRDTDDTGRRPFGDPVPEADAVALDGRRARDHAIRDAVAAAVPDTPAAGVGAVAGVVRMLVSLRSVAQTSARFDVSLATAGDAHAWAVETLINALRNKEVAPWRATESGQ